jgi:diguanylate cyclase (GGDEF)-like protein
MIPGHSGSYAVTRRQGHPLRGELTLGLRLPLTPGAGSADGLGKDAARLVGATLTTRNPRPATADARDERAEARERAADGVDTGAAADRAGALRDRRGGASDRAQAADDREAASADRVQSAREREASAIDELTGAHCRLEGMAELRREMARATRAKQPFVLAFIDVDDLKGSNDSLGHAAGDQLLRATVDSLRAHLHSYDLIIRFGGDEFLCGLADVTIDEAAKRFSLVNADLATLQMSVSVGLAAPAAGDTVDDLIGRADEDMYGQRGGRRSSRA